MQGLPLEGYQPLPPNPPEGYQPLPPNPPEVNYRREVENQFDVGSVIAPLLDNSEGTLVIVENPTPHTISVLDN
jgi:hypothetical protein